MELYIENHLKWRLLTPDDWDEMLSLRAQLEALDDLVLPATDRVIGGAARSMTAGDAIGGWDSYGNLSAFGWNIPEPGSHPAKLFLLGGVHPTHRYQGIGRALLAWQEERALAWRDEQHPGEPIWLGSYVEADQTCLRHLLVQRGFLAERYFFDMHRELFDLPRPHDIPGLVFENFTPERSRQVLELHNSCFSARIDDDAWAESLGEETFRADWSWVALRGDEVVGYCLSGTDDAAGLDGVMEGWCDRLGVAGAHRHQGVAEALLARSLRSRADSGCPAAGIGVDTRNRAVADWLHRVLGYEERDSVTLLGKSIPAA